MEFLYKLYENEYFGIGLFIVITILAFSLLLILFFGKKEGKNKEVVSEEPKNLEVTNEPGENSSLNTVSLEQEKVLPNEVISNEMNLDMPENNSLPVEEKVEEEVKSSEETDFNPFNSDDVVFDNNVLPEEPKMEANFNFEEDESSLDMNQDEEIDSNFSESLESQINEKTSVLESPIIEEEKMPEIFSQEDASLNNEEVLQAKPKTAFPNQFSSVYINREAERPIAEEPKVAELPKEEKEEEIKPVKPEFDLPKLNKTVTNDSIIKPVESNINNIINDLETESFDLEKKEEEN